MANLRVLVPDSTTNYVKNPSFRHNTDGWDIIATPWDVLYYLYDQFNTDVAAGSVNATNAEPVGGPRTVTDTNGKISIAGGVLSVATGKAANDGIWYPGTTRVLGKAGIWNINYSAITGIEIGFDVNQAGALTYEIAGQGFIDQAGLNPTGNYSTGTAYKFALIMRTSGMFYLVKGGAFTNWTLIWLHTTGTQSPLYPACMDDTGNGVVTADNIRVPKRLFIPVPLQSDGFSAATTDGAGNAEANAPVGNAWTGATWTVAGGAVTNAPTAGGEALTNGNMETGDPPSNWATAGSPTVDGVADERTGGAGSQSISVTTTSANYPYIRNSVSTVNGIWYLLTGWVKKVTGTSRMKFVNGAYSVTYASTPNITSTSWINNILTARALATETGLVIVQESVGGNGVEFRVDDVSIKPLTLSTLFRSLAHSSANVVADVAVTLAAGTQAGLVVNLDSAATPANFVIAYHDGTNCKLDKCVAGVYTNMISAAATYSAGAVLRVVHRSDNSYRLFYNNAAVGSATTIADAGIISNTLHGLFDTSPSLNSFDNYACWASGDEGQYSGLDSL